MIVIALVLIAAMVVCGVGVALTSSEAATLEVFGVQVPTTVTGVFFAGAVAMLVLLAGLWLLKVSLRRTYRKRKELKELRHQVAESPPPATTRTRGAAPATAGSSGAATSEGTPSGAATSGRGTTSSPPPSGSSTPTGPTSSTSSTSSTSGSGSGEVASGDERPPSPGGAGNR